MNTNKKQYQYKFVQPEKKDRHDWYHTIEEDVRDRIKPDSSSADILSNVLDLYTLRESIINQRLQDILNYKNIEEHVKHLISFCLALDKVESSFPAQVTQITEEYIHLQCHLDPNVYYFQERTFSKEIWAGKSSSEQLQVGDFVTVQVSKGYGKMCHEFIRGVTEEEKQRFDPRTWDWPDFEEKEETENPSS